MIEKQAFYLSDTTTSDTIVALKSAIPVLF